MKLVEVSCCMFLFSLLALTVQKHNSCLLGMEELTDTNVLVTYFMHSV